MADCCKKPDVRDISWRSFDVLNGWSEWNAHYVCLRCETHWLRGERISKREWNEAMDAA